MRGKFEDLTGRKFGKLTVLRRGEDIYYGKYHQIVITYICECECGNIKQIPGCHLRGGNVKSCGCSKGELISAAISHPHRNCTRKEYRIYEKELKVRYQLMMSRCYYKNDKSYRNYGGRRIGVCDFWRGDNGFEYFYCWSIDNGFSPELSLDRIDNEKEYSPENCRWATFNEQQNNKRNNVRVNVNGQEMTVAQAERMLGIPKNGVNRIRRQRDCTHQEAIEYWRNCH